MNFNQPVIDVIQQRYSCRKFKKSAIDESTNKNLGNYISENTYSPFESKIRFVLVSSKEGDSEELRGLGTYGFIRNPAGFIIGVGEKSEKYLEDFGYLMEKNILYATSLGLGSCWLGASFRKSSFEERAQINHFEQVLAVAAIGYSYENKSIFDRLVRFGIGAGSRKPWDALFYENDFYTMLGRDTDKYMEALEMVRLAPSASNKQPWRLVRNKTNNVYHLYLERTNGYNKLTKYRADLQRVDMGIAMCHFELTAKELDLTGKWKIDDPQIESTDTPREYVATWKRL